MGYLDKHLNGRCSTVVGNQPRSGKSVTTSWTTTLANCHDKPTLDWKDMTSTDKSDSGEKEDVQFYANVFKNKTGWKVYGARLEREQWVVKDMHGGCWSGDAYDDILKIFENHINLGRILYELNGEYYIVGYRERGDLPLDRFEYRLQDWIIELVRYNEEVKRKDEFYKEVFTGKVNDMGLRIKKTDVMSVEEFKECNKGYDEITIRLDVDKVKEFESDYGVGFNAPYQVDGDGLIIKLDNDATLEFMPKAIAIDGYTSRKYVPYDFIENIECTYYLKTE